MRTCIYIVSLAIIPALACGNPTNDGESDTEAVQTETSSDIGTSTGVEDDGSSTGTTSAQTETTASSEDTGTDGGSSTNGQTSETGETGGIDCVEVEVQEWIGLGEGANAIIALTIPQLGDPDLNDIVQIELYGSAPALDTPIDLSVAPNDNYGGCDQCVRLLEDVVGNDIDKQYFVDSGTITFTDLMMTGEMAGSISDLHFVEVTLDAGLNSTPVEGGDCVVINGQSDFETLPGG